MLWLNLAVVDAVLPKSNKFAMGLKINATCESKLNNSAVTYMYLRVRNVSVRILGSNPPPYSSLDLLSEIPRLTP